MKSTIIITIALTGLLGLAVATVDEAMEAVLVRTAPLHAHFETAKELAAEDDFADAAAAIAKAERMLRAQAAVATPPHGESLVQAADQLKVLGDDVSAGETEPDEMDAIFANTHATLADFYLGKSQRAAEANQPNIAGAHMIASANHLERGFKWAGQKIGDGTQGTLALLRRSGTNVITGTGKGLGAMGDVFKAGAATIAKVAGAKSDAMTTAAIVVGEDHVFQLNVPDGWLLDSESGMEHGLVALFYPKKRTWESAKVFAYSATLPRKNEHTGKVMSIADAVQSFIDDYQENGHSNYKGTKDGTIKLADGRAAEVYRFGGDAFGNFEICGFILEKKTINFVLMTGQKKEVFEKSMPQFRQLVGSYIFVSDDPTQEESYIAKMKGENWREKLPTEEKVPLRKKKHVRRHK